MSRVKETFTVIKKNPRMTINKALKEWHSKKRRMGCVSAAEWFCGRVVGFKPERLHRYTKQGDYFGHVVATDGLIRIDLTPTLDAPDES